MFVASTEFLKTYDIACMCAAVADYTPEVKFDHKVKKKDGDLSIKLKRTKDILKYFGEHKSASQVLVGFAMETENEVENATKKLNNKNADMIVLNSINREGAGFQHLTNQVTFVTQEKKPQNFSLKQKTEIAKDIVNKIIALKNGKGL